MFESLTSRLEDIFRKLKGRGVLTEENISEALKEVRLALLEADVNFRVVKELIERIRQRAVGQEVMRSITPGQQVVKIVYDETCSILGGEHKRITLSPNPPTVIMLVGLQGSGKTTTAGKIARIFKKDGRHLLLVAADVARPAAQEQLRILGEHLKVKAYADGNNAREICHDAISIARKEGYDVVILDTAGRLHINNELMKELVEIKESVKPTEILLVADAMTGQEAVNIAKRFNEELGLTGIILTKMEGDARGGAALSMMAVAGKPIRYIGTGEKLDALEPFHPQRIASRIMGMGDVLTLVERAEESLKEEDAMRLRKILTADSFNLEDFCEHLKKMRKLGPLQQLIEMIPGMKGFKPSDSDIDEKELIKTEAIINSMTKKERLNYGIINGSRRKRIAMGSGTTVSDVNRVLKQFVIVKKMLKSFSGKEGRFKMPFNLGRGLPF